jgi:chitinase
MKRRTAVLAGAVVALVAGAAAAGTAVSQAQTAQAAIVAPPSVPLGGAPYIYPATGGKDPVAVMHSTGVKAFTLAFILDKGGCTPAWDGSGSLTGSAITNRINAIRNAGGDVVVSFGGYSGPKLGKACGSASALAGAYQKVIDAYRLRAIDIDLEAGEVSQSSKVLNALKITKQKNPDVQIIMTLGTGINGLDGGEAKIPGQAVSTGATIDVWTIMPFDFGGRQKSDMGKLSVQASEGLHKQLKGAYKSKSDAQVYAMQGISSMNGKTDEGETVTVANFDTMLTYAHQHHLARFTFWELNRDGKLQYTKVIGQF